MALPDLAVQLAVLSRLALLVCRNWVGLEPLATVPARQHLESSHLSYSLLLKIGVFAVWGTVGTFRVVRDIDRFD